MRTTSALSLSDPPSPSARRPASFRPPRDSSRRPAPSAKEGDVGASVETLQRLLNARLDPSPELSVDGDFGAATRTALIRYQRSKRLNPSGVADPKTWESLGPPLPAEPEPPAPRSSTAVSPRNALPTRSMVPRSSPVKPGP